MSADIGRFNPAAWHEGGVLRAHKATLPPTAKRRITSAALTASAVVSLSTVCAMPACATLVLGATLTAAALPFPARIRDDTQADTRSDRIDPSEWGKLVTLFERLPRDNRPEPPDPEPFI